MTGGVPAWGGLRPLEVAVSASRHGILVTDPNQPDNPIVYVNPAFERLTGYRAEEVIGRNCRFLQGDRDEGQDRAALEELRAAVREGRGCRVALRNFRKDGTPFLNDLSISPARDESGRLTAFVGVQEDVTERRRAEEALREAREAERARIARDIHDEALQDIVHALQQIELVKALGGRGGDLDEVSAALKRSVEGLRGAIYDLRLERHGERSFTEMLLSLVKMNRRRSPGREITLSVEEFSAGLPLDEDEQVELLRIVQEALTNARRHSGAQSISVSVGVSRNRLWAEVSDDGRGFDAEEAAGMGSRTMRERARALGGELEVESKAGEGTTVRFEVPLGGPEGEDRETDVARILLVEDHASFRQAVASMLDLAPEFEVVGQAGTLAEAREVIGAKPVDVAIIDLGLPDGYGGDLIKELRGANPGAQALVLSASLDRARIAQAVEYGAAGVLHKAAGMDEVVEAVRRLRAGETLLPLSEVVELLRFAGSRREEEQEARHALAQLTPREKEVLQALAEGLDGREIAERLRISVTTERNHTARILAKLGVHSRLQALVFALRHGAVKIS